MCIFSKIFQIVHIIYILQIILVITQMYSTAKIKFAYK